MASNFFQRWSDRSLATKDTVQIDLEQSDNVAIEATANDPVDRGLHTESNVDHCVEGSAEGGTASTADLHQSSTSTVVSVEEADNAEEALTIDDADSVTFDSGVASFLQQGVDKSVKKAALKKLFHSDEFNYISDMDDHTEDFSNIPKLKDSVAKQLRGWVKTVLEEPEQVTELVEESATLEEPENQLTIAPETPVVDDETAESGTEDNTALPCCDTGKNKLEQTGET